MEENLALLNSQWDLCGVIHILNRQKKKQPVKVDEVTGSFLTPSFPSLPSFFLFFCLWELVKERHNR